MIKLSDMLRLDLMV